VDGVSLSLEAGKTLCLVGESDSGIGVRARSQGTILDFGCTDLVGPELGQGFRHLNGLLPKL
jgi:ABC-type dipeptide/oligopeptide/nickel transport system ATPase component